MDRRGCHHAIIHDSGWQGEVSTRGGRRLRNEQWSGLTSLQFDRLFAILAANMPVDPNLLLMIKSSTIGDGEPDLGEFGDGLFEP